MVCQYLICGAGRVGVRLSCFLASFGYEVTLIDIELEPRVYEITREYKDKIRLISGDGSSEEVLEKAGISTAFCLISTIGKYTANVRVILAARRWREKTGKQKDLKIIARVSNEQQASLLTDLADYILFPEEEGSWEIAALVRTMKEKDLKKICMILHPFFIYM
ncbi:MAG: potassium channel family protein [Candidatus Hodarchaeota archaeon]